MQRTGPLTMLNDLKNWKTDVPSGLVVFLVAIPLCLGIASASGAPAMSGIIAGIIGGLVVTLFSNSPLGVSGPAAGLVAIVEPAIVQLGFGNFLLAVVLAGVIQFLLGLFKAGMIGYYFPTSVIKGMLAAIGLIIILKQIPHALGYDKDPEGDVAFQQDDGYNTFSEIQHALETSLPAAVIITAVCLAILIFWETKFMKKFSFTKIIQGPLVAVIAGILLNITFGSFDSMRLESKHMVQLNPAAEVVDDNSSAVDSDVAGRENSGKSENDGDDSGEPTEQSGGIVLTFPSFDPSEITSTTVSLGHGSSGHDSHENADNLAKANDKLATLQDAVNDISDKKSASQISPIVDSIRELLSSNDSTEESNEASASVFTAILLILVTAATLAVVASLESLLCAEATDKLDPQRRQTDLNQELRAQGIGNFISGLIGGLPVTQVIVRSSTNIQSGAQSRLAAFVHGIFLIACVLAIPGILELIPFASLAAILFVVGYKLAHPSKFKEMFLQGWSQFFPFIITIVAILYTDLLIGIAIGLVASLFFILGNSYFKSLWIKVEEIDGRKVHRLTLAERVFFINKGNIQSAIQQVTPGSKVIIDASNTVHVDQDVMDIFSDFKTHAEFDEIEIEWIGELHSVKITDPARIQALNSSTE